MEYKVQIDDNSYVVKIEEMTVSNALNKTAEDIAYSAFLSEYDHCVQCELPEKVPPKQN